MEKNLEEVKYYPHICQEGSNYGKVKDNMTEDEIHKIAKEAAKEAVKELGLTPDDVKDLKTLLSGVRIASKEVLIMMLRIAILGLCVLGGIKYIQ